MVIPAVFVVPAFILCGAEVGFIVLIYTAIMVQRCFKELRQLPLIDGQAGDMTKVYRRNK